MDDKSSGHVEQAMAIKGYGCFAAVSEGCEGSGGWKGEGEQRGKEGK
jgi:hypothetical protein